MTHSHLPDGGVLLMCVVVAAIGYEVLATASGGWPRWRTMLFLGGATLLVAGLTPAALPWAPGDLRNHMLQHLLVGMLAPLALVLGAPVTLVLRTVPRPAGRFIGRLLRSRVVHMVAHPVTALILNVGGFALLYLTPLYAATTRSPALHLLVHVHFLLAGYLFAWVVAGPDPAPRRPSVPTRLVVLGVAITFHSVLSQLMYAGIVDLPVSVAERAGGAELMYYGGDIAELLLAVALVAGWRPRRHGPKTARPAPARAPAVHA